MTDFIKITPVKTTTKGGLKAVITNIDMNSGDPFNGIIYIEDGKVRKSRWRSNGDVRDGSVNYNLIMQNPEINNLYEKAKILGARLN